jgi:SAM-dependent methyltransferase
MLSRRSLFTFGLSKVAERMEERFDAELLDSTAPAPPRKPRGPARPNVPPPRASWPHTTGAELWAPVTQALPRAIGEHVLEVDELDYDLAELPFDDDEFDGAVSAFAPMFSSDGGAAIAELCRVVRPGGTVAFTAWTPAGIVGRLLALAEEHEPSPPGTVAPLEWGREERLRTELDRHSDDYELRPGGLTLSFGSRGEALDRLFAALRPLAWAPRVPELRLRAEAIVDGLTGDGQGAPALRATYVTVVARPRSTG